MKMLALACRRREIEVLEEAKKKGMERAERNRCVYLEGMAAAYAEIWELAAYGRRLTSKDLDNAKNDWGELVEEQQRSERGDKP